MSWLEISLAEPRFLFAPGETIAGTASWSLDGDPREVELRLFWFTQGKGDEDVGIVDRTRFEAPGRQDRREFRLRIPPAGPLSFSGQLTTHARALELVVEPGEQTRRLELLVSASGREIRLEALDPPPDASRGSAAG
jgi:hypothetical protein